MEAGSPPPGPYPPGQYRTEVEPPRRPPPGPGWWVGAIVAALALAAGAFFLGQSVGASDERDEYAVGQPGYQAIYDQGFAAGQGKGQAEGQAEGAQAGKKAGFEEGEAAGETKGTKAGANAALGGFSDWVAGAPYIVRVKTGPSADVPWVLSTRTQMQPDTDYALCQTDPESVCTEATGDGG
jgi:hypothetical protein